MSSYRNPEVEADIVYCSQWAYSWALRNGLTEADAADIRQIAALRLIISPRTSRKTSKEWLERLAVQCLQALKKARLEAAHLDEEEVEAAKPPDATLREKLAEAISRLSAKERYVFEQCNMAAIPPAEVAQAVGHPVNYVYLQDSRARARLRRYLKQEDEDLDKYL